MLYTFDTSADPYAEKRKASRKAKEEMEVDNSGRAGLEHYRPINLRREDLRKMIHEPYFDEFVIGCFVSMNDGGGSKVMCEIVGVSSGPDYKFTGGLEREVLTSKRLILSSSSVDAKPRGYRMALISDHFIHEDSLQKYLEGLTTLRSTDPITVKEATRRKEKNKKLRNRSYTTEDINAMTEKKNMNMASLTLTDQRRILRDQQQAILDAIKEDKKKFGKSSKYKDLDDTVKKLERVIGDIKKQRAGFQKNVQASIDLNERNKASNRKKDEKAATKKKTNRDGDAEGLDPFKRRDTAPTTVWITGKKLEKLKEKEVKTAQIKELQDEIQRLKERRNPDDSDTIDDLDLQLIELKDSVGEADASKDAEDALNAKSVVKKAVAVADIDVYIGGVEDLETIRRSVAAKLGFDPLEDHRRNLTKADKYLRSISHLLPPRGEREAVRKGISFQKYKELYEKRNDA